MERPRWITIVVLVLLVVLVWWWWRRRTMPADHVAKRERPELLLNRAWVSAPPKDKDKRTFRHALVVLDVIPVGVFQRASSFRFEAERFEHELDGNKLGVRFPQTGKRAKITFHITACNTVPDFDLCLKLDSNPWGGPRLYYGQRNPDKRRRALRRALRTRALQAR